MSVIGLSGVTVSHGDQVAVEGVDLTIDAGEFVGIVGPNGGGKTTLLRAALGLHRPTHGTVRLFDTPLDRFRDWHRLAHVPQHAIQVDARFPATVYEVALLGRLGRRTLLRRLTAEDHEKTRDALEEVGVADLADRRIGALSGGQRQRVFLAKALAREPELLILDEPTTGVDPDARASFYQLLDHLNHDHQITIVLVSHDTQAVALSAHRLIALNRGIVFDGLPEAYEAEGGHGAAWHIDIAHTEVGH